MNEFAKENNLERPTLSEKSVRILSEYHWPGNARELRNFCEKMVILKRGDTITEYDLEPRFLMKDDDYGTASSSAGFDNLSVEENEKRLLRNALSRSGGNRTKAAEMLGVSRRTLHRKLAQWPELDVRSIKSEQKPTSQ